MNMLHHDPKTCTHARCRKCDDDFDRRRKEEAERFARDYVPRPPSYSNAKKPPSYQASEEKARRDKWYDEQYRVMKDDMKKNCHQIVGESDLEFAKRKGKWKQAIDIKFLNLDYDKRDRADKQVSQTTKKSPTDEATE